MVLSDQELGWDERAGCGWFSGVEGVEEGGREERERMDKKRETFGAALGSRAGPSSTLSRSETSELSSRISNKITFLLTFSVPTQTNSPGAVSPNSCTA